MKFVEKAIPTFVFIAIVLLLWGVYNSTYYNQSEYALSEIESGVYCIYNTVSSKVPAENYEIVTLCCNSQIMTFKGSIDIICSTDKPHVIIKDYNIANGDKIIVYVPNNTVKFQENVGV